MLVDGATGGPVQPVLGHLLPHPGHQGVPLPVAAGPLQVVAQGLSQPGPLPVPVTLEAEGQGAAQVGLLPGHERHAGGGLGAPQGLLHRCTNLQVDLDEAPLRPGPVGLGLGAGGVRQGGVELEEGGVELGQHLHPQQGGGLQLGADAPPGLRGQLGEGQEEPLEHPALEPGQPGQHPLGL